MDYGYRDYDSGQNGNFGNGQNGNFGAGNNPFGNAPGSNFNYGRKMKYPKFIPQNDWQNEKRRIKILSISAASGIFAFLILSNLTGELFYYLSSVFKFDITDGSDALFVYEMVYSLICVGLPFFVIYNILKKRGFYRVSLPLEKPVNTNLLPYFIIGGVAVCFAGDIITSLSATFSDVISKASENSSAALFGVPKTWSGIVLMALSNAVIPALVEEFAIRGVVMQPLRRYGDEFAIVVSSVIFGMLHCNIAQIPFAMLAGCVLGYVAIITNSLWPSIIIHCINNGYSVLVSVLADKFGMMSVPVIIVSGVVFYGVIIAGGILIYSYFKKPYRPHIRMSSIVNKGKNFYNISNPYSASVSYMSLAKAYFVNTAMIIAIILIVIMTKTSLNLQ